jgi:hypothetical protein
MSVAICAIFRNEAPYIREWLEFHRIVGVERFYLYQNRSDDDWRNILQPYLDEGVVEVTEWPLPSPCQQAAYGHFFNQHRGEPRWVAFLDCDEFLFSPYYATISEVLDRLPPQWGALAVNWVCFGASGREQHDPGLVIERFTLRPADNFGPNVHIKSIVRMDHAESVGPDPHHFCVSGGTCDESGRQVSGPLTLRPRHRLLRVNHYVTKSREEYVRRISRGRADMPAQRDPREFDSYQAADVNDQAILRFLPALKSRLERTKARGHF